MACSMSGRLSAPAPTHRIALVFALMVAACWNGPGAPSSMRTDSAGITLVTWAGEDRALAWTLEPRYTLGGRETGAESFYQVYAGVVGADARGNLHVLDGGAHRIVVFDSTGAFVRQMGGEGGGPGEFSRALAFSVSADGTAGVFDLGKRSIVRFRPDGAIVDGCGRRSTTSAATSISMGPLSRSRSRGATRPDSPTRCSA